MIRSLPSFSRLESFITISNLDLSLIDFVGILLNYQNRHLTYMIHFNRNLSDQELLQEKKKDYRNVVIIQTVIVTVGLVLSDIILREQESIRSRLIITLFSTFSAVYAFLLWDMMRNFTRNQILIKGVLSVLILVVIIGAGIAGLSAAILLAEKGFKVKLIERDNFIVVVNKQTIYTFAQPNLFVS